MYSKRSITFISGYEGKLIQLMYEYELYTRIIKKYLIYNILLYAGSIKKSICVVIYEEKYDYEYGNRLKRDPVQKCTLE